MLTVIVTIFDLVSLMITSVVIAFLSAVTSQIYTNVITQPHHIFAGWKRWLDKIFNYGGNYKNQRREEDHWLYKILIGCEKCNTGQLSLWTFVTVVLMLYWGEWMVLIMAIPFLWGTVSTAIFLVAYFKYLYQKWDN